MLTAPLLAQIMQCPVSRAQRWAGPLNAAMKRFGINTPVRAAYFLAQLGHESLSLSRTEESLSYSRDRLLEVFGRHVAHAEAAAFVHRPVKLGNRAYANRNGNGNEASGDGYLFRGRGPLLVFAIATMGLPKSLSVMPVARHRARAPAMLRPWVVVRERS